MQSCGILGPVESGDEGMMLIALALELERLGVEDVNRVVVRPKRKPLAIG